MPNKTPAMISAISTVLLLIVLAVLSLLIQMVALNGASERQGVTAMGISLACQGIVLILAGIFARWFTNLMITRFNWNQILAVIIAVFVSTLVGGAISFLPIIASFLLAGIR
ncbi:MAG TPA: hypothetical protein VMN99_05485 [Anaerolineales bacterium]|nr:hypothetical protein [Anaerolineales bacterium]